MENNLKSIGSKPIGLKGLIAGKIMNLIHSAFYRRIINEIIIPNKSSLLPLNILNIY